MCFVSRVCVCVEFADVCAMVQSASGGSCGVLSLQAVLGCPALLWVWEELLWAELLGLMRRQP